MSAIYHNLTNWKLQDVILLILTQYSPVQSSTGQQLRDNDVCVITGEKQEL